MLMALTRGLAGEGSDSVNEVSSSESRKILGVCRLNCQICTTAKRTPFNGPDTRFLQILAHVVLSIFLTVGMQFLTRSAQVYEAQPPTMTRTSSPSSCLLRHLKGCVYVHLVENF